MVWALLPLKDFVNAKQRLSGVLNASERRRLFHAMVEDVLAVLTTHEQIEKTVIVSDDPSAELLASRYGAEIWSEDALQAKGLNGVIDAAAARLATLNVKTMVVVHGDLPLINGKELQSLFELHCSQPSPALTIASDRRQTGSNCLLATPPNVIAYQYGENSFKKHQRIAVEQNVVVNTTLLPDLSIDIDIAEDLQRLCRIERDNTHTMSYLKASGIKERLNMMLDKSTLEKATASPLYKTILQPCLEGKTLSDEQALSLAEAAFSNEEATTSLMETAQIIRDQGFRNVVTFSKKVFIPLTHLCRDVCHYCTFAQTPKKIPAPYMSVEQVLETVKDAAKQGCKEALFTLGEKPELRYSAARKALEEMGFSSTLEYVAHVAKRVFDETGVIPHINAGCMTEEEIAMLRPVSASMGIMLESASTRLCEKGMPHYGSPDKDPAVRLQTIANAGKANVPFTSGILIGIGETRRERIESLLALREQHLKYGHIQEIIVQNFRAKPGTKMAEAPEPDLNELLWTIAVARLIFGAEVSVQAPPNLSPGVLPKLIDAGINDWGGVSPVTPDFVNPEAPWPHLEKLAKETANAGKYLHERLTIYPQYAIDYQRWLDQALHVPVLRMIDGEGFPKVDHWAPGETTELPQHITQLLDQQALTSVSEDVKCIVIRARTGEDLTEKELVRLFQARGEDLAYIYQQANECRQQVNGDTVSYVVNRNINYTNICYFKCQFCAFSKGKLSENLRGRPYDLGHEEISRRCDEAWRRGATEVCMQGGIHPDYTGETYIDIVKTVKSVTPDMHVHAFSPLEVWQGAATLNISVEKFLEQLKEAGLSTLPGTAAEILDDEVRAILCADKINTEQWLEVMETAHKVGLKTTATVMYGHVEQPKHLARHLLCIRELQKKTGGFTEFVPLPFVHMEAPLYLKGKARSGPTFREAILMHAIARLALNPYIKNIQASWVKMGEQGVIACLNAGANDLGGTLMNETITRAAGAEHGQEFSPEKLESMIVLARRQPRQRSTDYQEVPAERVAAGKQAAPLEAVVNTPAKKYERKQQKKHLIANS